MSRYVQEFVMGERSPQWTVVSGDPRPDLPYRYGCICGAVWNSSTPLKAHEKALCGAFCKAHLTPLKEGE